MRHRTITLTDRAPVRVTEDQWPVIASITTYASVYPDPGRQHQAELQGQAEKYSLFVRRGVRVGLEHVIVYGISMTGADGSCIADVERRHGDIMSASEELEAVPSQEIARLIHCVAERCRIPREIADECIADLPPEDLG